MGFGWAILLTHIVVLVCASSKPSLEGGDEPLGRGLQKQFFGN